MDWSPDAGALRGRVAVVAGATRGAGRGIAALLMVTGIAFFGVLTANVAAFFGAGHYHYVAEGRHYLSPFYSPVFWASPGDTAGLEHAWFGVPLWLRWRPPIRSCWQWWTWREALEAIGLSE